MKANTTRIKNHIQRFLEEPSMQNWVYASNTTIWYGLETLGSCFVRYFPSFFTQQVHYMKCPFIGNEQHIETKWEKIPSKEEVLYVLKQEKIY